MLVATWNVNSLKSRLDHVLRWLGEFKPDVVLLQELKCLAEAFPHEALFDAGYNVAVVGQKTYNGVAVLSRYPLDEISLEALPGDPEDLQARYVEVVTNTVRIASLYLPNGNPLDSEKFPYKLAWMERLNVHVRNLLAQEQAFILGGDFNVIPQVGDVHDPAAFKNDALFAPATLAAWRSLLNQGLVDSYRALNPETGRYSWWDYRGGAWQKDHGARIDFLLCSPQAADRLTASGIDRTPRGWEKASDHTPVWCQLTET